MLPDTPRPAPVNYDYRVPVERGTMSNPIYVTTPDATIPFHPTVPDFNKIPNPAIGY
jgi:hypothetical protein